MTDTTNEDAQPYVDQQIGSLNKKLDAVIDHVASNFGGVETRLSSIESNCSEHFGLLESRLNASSDVLEVIGDRLNDMEVPPATQDRSAIYTALAAAQVEINNAITKTDNEFTKKKYADLASVLDAVRPHLSANGIALFQITEDVSTSMLGIRTVLAHGESGQTIEDHITMSPPKLDPQGIGSCRTYMRRYAILALTGIAGASDDDAEGTKARLKPSEVEKILYHADELFGNEHADDAVELMLKNVFSSEDAKVIGDIPAGELDVAINALDRLKAKRDKQIATATKAEKAAAKAAKE